MVESSFAGASAIVVEELTFAWRNPDGTETQVLAGMDFRVKRGEFVVIVGPSGCGKSTLLHLIAGLENIDKGRLSVEGQPVSGVSPKRFLLAQQPSLFPWLNIAQNVEFGPRMQGVGVLERQRAGAGVLEAVGLKEWGKSYPHQLSGGMRQRASMARALVNRPEILLMDEPFAALDYPARRGLQDFLLHVHAEFKPTIIFVTHMPEEALILADRVMVFTRRPAKIKLEFEISLPRPRVTTAPAFNKLLGDLLNILDK